MVLAYLFSVYGLKTKTEGVMLDHKVKSEANTERSFEEILQVSESICQRELTSVTSRDCLPFPEMGFDFEELGEILSED